MRDVVVESDAPLCRAATSPPQAGGENLVAARISLRKRGEQFDCYAHLPSQAGGEHFRCAAFPLGLSEGQLGLAGGVGKGVGGGVGEVVEQPFGAVAVAEPGEDAGELLELAEVEGVEEDGEFDFAGAVAPAVGQVDEGVVEGAGDHPRFFDVEGEPGAEAELGGAGAVVDRRDAFATGEGAHDAAEFHRGQAFGVVEGGGELEVVGRVEDAVDDFFRGLRVERDAGHGRLPLLRDASLRQV